MRLGGFWGSSPVGARRRRGGGVSRAGARVRARQAALRGAAARERARDIPALSGLAALLGYAVFGGLSAGVIAATTAVAAGAMLAMLADTMIPEAFESAGDAAGLVTVAGFLVAFVLTKVGGG